MTAGRSEGDQLDIGRPGRAVSADEGLVAALRRGDEHAFAALVRAHHPALVRLARTSVSSDAVAEEVAQETWLAVIEGIDRFEGRSSLKTWIFSILVNKARTRGVRDRRVVPISSLGARHDDARSVDPDRFVREGRRWGGHWSQPPAPWTQGPRSGCSPRRRWTSRPARSRSCRSVSGRSSRCAISTAGRPEETCAPLELSEGNQRVLLHRARSQVRSVLECHFGAEAED